MSGSPGEESAAEKHREQLSMLVPVSPPPRSAQQSGEPMMVQPHSAWQAVILSFFIPGTGSIINDKARKGILIMCCYVAAIIFQMVVSAPILGNLELGHSCGVQRRSQMEPGTRHPDLICKEGSTPGG